jgi:hypothetical protein
MMAHYLVKLSSSAYEMSRFPSILNESREAYGLLHGHDNMYEMVDEALLRIVTEDMHRVDPTMTWF